MARTFIPDPKTLDETFVTESELLDKVTPLIQSNVENYIYNTQFDMSNFSTIYFKNYSEYDTDPVFEIQGSKDTKGLVSYIIRPGCTVLDTGFRSNYDTMDLLLHNFAPNQMTFEFDLEKYFDGIILGTEFFGLMIRYKKLYFTTANYYYKIADWNYNEKVHFKFIYSRYSQQESEIYINSEKLCTLEPIEFNFFNFSNSEYNLQDINIRISIRFNGWFINEKHLGDFEFSNIKIYGNKIL